MCRALKDRLTLALIEREFAESEKLEIKTFGQEAFSYEARQMETVVEESERLKQEAVNITKVVILRNNHIVCNAIILIKLVFFSFCYSCRSFL